MLNLKLIQLYSIEANPPVIFFQLQDMCQIYPLDLFQSWTYLDYLNTGLLQIWIYAIQGKPCLLNVSAHG